MGLGRCVKIASEEDNTRRNIAAGAGIMGAGTGVGAGIAYATRHKAPTAEEVAHARGLEYAAKAHPSYQTDGGNFGVNQVDPNYRGPVDNSYLEHGVNGGATVGGGGYPSYATDGSNFGVEYADPNHATPYTTDGSNFGVEYVDPNHITPASKVPFDLGKFVAANGNEFAGAGLGAGAGAGLGALIAGKNHRGLGTGIGAGAGALAGAGIGHFIK